MKFIHLFEDLINSGELMKSRDATNIVSRLKQIEARILPSAKEAFSSIVYKKLLSFYTESKEEKIKEPLKERRHESMTYLGGYTKNLESSKYHNKYHVIHNVPIAENSLTIKGNEINVQNKLQEMKVREVASVL
jgi:hypothetical protein